MKAIIQSYSPEEVERIARGEQTIKVCKTAPQDTPFKVYMYMTKKGKQRFTIRSGATGLAIIKRKNGKVVGEYVCERVEQIYAYSSLSLKFGEYDSSYNIDKYKHCLSYRELADYLGEPIVIEETSTAKICEYKSKALHIHAVKFYDEPKELSEFKTIKCTNKRGSCSDCKTKPDCIKQITRPPQGWQHVEDIGQ